MTKKSFGNLENLLSFWESFKLETLNQKISRMVLGVHKKSSRLGVLGELGRFPLLIKGLCHVLKYQAHMSKISDQNSIIYNAVQEMRLVKDEKVINWWTRTEKIKNLLGINYSQFSKLEVIGSIIKKCVKSKFEAYWLKSINKQKLGENNENRNKLRFYLKKSPT